ncbi:MAG: thioredoxin domain-containing protein, partial [Verrucomicrobiae bacterium]|nr:thioredoxin domain-containing protein [Verrucomicrobiae bacterium]
MRTRLRVAILLVVAFWAGSLSAAEPAGDGIDWQPWSDGIFERAKAEKKLVLLDLGAVWCHWCHVMDEQTYRDPEVIRLLRDRYIAVRVDQDARPDLSNRYEDYGWPATIVFKWDGSELAKRRGYIPPKPMASMLQAFVDDPTPGPSVQEEAPITPSSATALSDAQRVEMRKALTDAYDRERGGWGTVHKYLNWDALEFSLIEGAGGDSEMKEMARRTLISGQKLIDPAWGGVYQYSTDGDWDHPHFEKIMPFQAENLRVFAIAATLDPDPRWMGSARKIRAYLKNFLTSPEGAFYTSQDADRVQGEHSAKYFALGDRERRKLGVPRIDRHVYSRENGTAITGLCALYASSGDASCLADAERAAKWVLEHRSLPGGGFRHDERDSAGPYLADSLQMARAFLALYTVTADRAWLARAQTAADFIDSNFRGDAGFATSAKSAASALPPKLQVDEN